MTAFHIYLYGPDAGAFSASFDAVADRLSRLEKLYQEPDGSFCWSPTSDASIFGMIYDAADHVQYIELRGHCDLGSWQQLVTAISSDETRDLVAMCLLKRQLQDLQTFEQSVWNAKTT